MHSIHYVVYTTQPSWPLACNASLLLSFPLSSSHAPVRHHVPRLAHVYPLPCVIQPSQLLVFFGIDPRRTQVGLPAGKAAKLRKQNEMNKNKIKKDMREYGIR